MAKRYPIKRGDTLCLAASIALPGAGWSATAQIKRVNDAGALVLITDVPVVLTAPVAPATDWAVVIGATFDIPADWELGDYRIDLRFTASGYVTHTSTGIISVVQEITEAP